MSANKPKTAALMATPQDIEAQFYEALQRGDIEALMAVWSDDEDIVCVHPGGPRIVGAAAIRATFDSIFANGPINVHPEKLRTVNTGHCAVHNLMERVDISTDEGPNTAWVIATNVYIKTDQGWRLVAHHASPGSPRELQEVTEAPSVLH
ncbi:MAG: YybH family protein [Betaproteobacteria bacterium]